MWTLIFFAYPLDLVTIRQGHKRTKIIRCYAGVRGFRYDGEQEKEEDEQGCGRDELERGERKTIEGEEEDVTQAVLGLSARWIWHLEEQRPLTLRCGRAAACVASLVHTRHV